MMRFIVCTALFVWSVASVRWPVSAMRSAHSIVSRSRISPMRTTSGSSRRTAFRAFGKECVSACSSRWFTMQRLWVWRNSIGSSIVTMCFGCSRLILSSMVASVVDLPEPVGPVTRTRPRGLLHSPSTMFGMPSSRKPRISYGICRKTADTAPRCRKQLPRKRARPFTPKDKSSSSCSSKRCFWTSVRIE
jgi:hypothetical protein